MSFGQAKRGKSSLGRGLPREPSYLHFPDCNLQAPEEAALCVPSRTRNQKTIAGAGRRLIGPRTSWCFPW